MRLVEAVLWEHAADSYLTQHPEAEACNSAHAFVTDAGYFERLQRMVNGCERNYQRALKEIHHPKAKVGQALPPANPEAPPQKAVPTQAPAAAEPPQPEQSKTTSAKLGSLRQNPKTPPPAASEPPEATPLASPLAGPHASASPAKTWSRSSDPFPDPDGNN
jgi:hypothetical protein